MMPQPSTDGSNNYSSNDGDEELRSNDKGIGGKLKGHYLTT